MVYLGEPSQSSWNGKRDRFSHVLVREPGFNSYPFHPLDGTAPIRSGEARRVPARVGSEGVDAPPAGADPIREGPGQAPQEEPVPAQGLRLR